MKRLLKTKAFYESADVAANPDWWEVISTLTNLENWVLMWTRKSLSSSLRRRCGNLSLLA